MTRSPWQLLSLVFLILSGGLGACRQDAAPFWAQVDGLRSRYNILLKHNFPRSLHGAEADKLLDALDHFGGPQRPVAEARELARKLRGQRERHPDHPPLPSGFDLKNASVHLKVVGRTPRERVWLDALKVGASERNFLLYWKPCFFRDGALWRRTGMSACSKRLRYQSLEAVRVQDGQITELIKR